MGSIGCRVTIYWLFKERESTRPRRYGGAILFCEKSGSGLLWWMSCDGGINTRIRPVDCGL